MSGLSKKEVLATALNSMLWCPGQVPFTRVGTPVPPSSAVLAVNLPKLPLLWKINCCHRKSMSPSATATEGRKASLKVPELCRGGHIPKGPPPVLDQATSLLSPPSPSHHAFLGLQLENSFEFIWETHLANKTEKFELHWKTMHCL